MHRLLNKKWIIACTMVCISIILLCIRWYNRPVVHYAKQLEIDRLQRIYDGESLGNFKAEVFIIENAPHNKRKLINIIKNNEKFCPIDEKRIKDRYDWFVRSYYKESRQTHVNFIQKDKDNGIGNHDEDMICRIMLIKSYDRHQTAASIVANSFGVLPSKLPENILDSIAHLPDSIRNGWGWKWECNCPELGY